MVEGYCVSFHYVSCVSALSDAVLLCCSMYYQPWMISACLAAYADKKIHMWFIPLQQIKKNVHLSYECSKRGLSHVEDLESLMWVCSETLRVIPCDSVYLLGLEVGPAMAGSMC
jgi:hypothetical protein